MEAKTWAIPSFVLNFLSVRGDLRKKLRWHRWATLIQLTGFPVRPGITRSRARRSDVFNGSHNTEAQGSARPMSAALMFVLLQKLIRDKTPWIGSCVDDFDENVRERASAAKRFWSSVWNFLATRYNWLVFSIVFVFLSLKVTLWNTPSGRFILKSIYQRSSFKRVIFHQGYLRRL